MYTTLSRNLVASAILLVAGCGVALAGNGNTITIEQTNTGLGIGNSLTVDQSLANGSGVGGASLNGDNQLVLSTTAKQTGSGNTANLTIERLGNSDGGHIGLLQDNSNSLMTPNNATISILGGGLGLVFQDGGNNLATLNVNGSSAAGSIYQSGNDNKAGLSVSGSDASGSVTQIGNSSDIHLSVSGAGTSASYTVIGSNVASPVNGAQVISNGATVTITQTTLP